MRLDKFLKVSRLIKRRTVATDAANDEKIFVNDRVAKPSTTLKVGDIIQINYFKKTVIVKVLALLSSTKKEDADQMFEIISIEDNKAVD
ncbi:MAG: RNA-binding S4 domain-containing protein [Bacilli bacterium]